jgi:N-acetylneuraminic acid mutarotase
MKKIFILFFIVSSISFAQSYGTWKLTDTLKITCPYATSVELANGNILVTGGLDKNGSNFTNQTEIFDFKNEKWNTASPMIVGRGTHVMVRLNNGNVIAIGGYGTKTCEILDTLPQTWSLTDSLHDLRVDGETATLLDNGNVLITGGDNYAANYSMKNLKSCEIYNVNQAKWILTDSLNSVRAFHTATKLLNGKVLIAGGSSKKDCEIFDPAIGKWTDAAPMNFARNSHTATLLQNGKVLLTGGDIKISELYDPLQNTWTVVDTTFSPGTGISELLKNGLMLFANLDNHMWYLYDIDKFSVVHTITYPARQLSQLINILPNGKVLSAGGMTYNAYTPENIDLVLSYTKMCYLYDPNGIDAVEQPKNLLPKDFRLYQNYPNPFNPSTIIKYELPKTSHVIIKIYNSLGDEVTTLLNQTQPVGSYSVNFNAKNLSSGIYFCRIVAGDWVSTNKMLLIK